MSDIKLFRLEGQRALELHGVATDLERPLQTLIETNLEPLLAVRFIATEYSTGKTHAGRIDTLGLDEDNCPVILEYKRSSGETVINQGLFYLDWLLDHKGEFHLLVQKKLNAATAEAIDWSAPRLICIASDFTRYDSHAVQQIGRNIELIRYRRFGSDLLLLELANAVSASGSVGSSITKTVTPKEKPRRSSKGTGADKTIVQWLQALSPEMRVLFETLEGYVLSLGDDVQRKDLKLYIAYKRLRNFVTVEIRKDKLVLFLRLDPKTVEVGDSFARDVRKIGHWGTGDLELSIRAQADLERAKPLLRAAYDGV